MKFKKTDAACPAYTLTNYQSLKFLYLNAMGISNKLDELQAAVSATNPDVIGITETHLAAPSSPCSFSLPGYVIHRSDRVNGRHGGVAIYVKSIHSSTLSTVSADTSGEWESVWCSLILPQSKTIQIGCYYRIPSNPLPAHWPSLLDSLKQSPAATQNNSVLIMGDFNFPTINWSTSSTTQSINSASYSFLNFLQEIALNQSVTSATHHREDQRSSLLDLIITSTDLSISSVIILLL